MRRTLTWRLGIIIIGVIIATMIINSITTYRTAYNRLYEAAGVEAYGCAAITTGLLLPGDIHDLMHGDRSAEIGEKLNWTVEHKDIFENQYILSLDGKILALDDNMKQQGFQVGNDFYYDKEAIKMLTEMKHSTYSKIYEYGGMKRISGYAPIYEDHDQSKEIAAISVIDFNADIVSERTWEVVKDGILLSIIPLILAALLTLLLIRRKTKPISMLIEQTKSIADGDISNQAIHVASKDEVGDLARNLDGMSANLRDLITTIKGTSDSLVGNANDTSVSMNEIKTAFTQVSQNMEKVAAGTSDGAKMTADASHALTNLAQLIRHSSEKAEISVQSAEQTMLTAGQGKQKIDEVVKRMEAIKTSTIETQQTIEMLSAHTNEIQSITGAITDIADQTNLLALNASIEAARAGENGKGFAVVADEVRKLAEQSNKEAENVGRLVAKITANITETAGRMEESHQYVQEGEQTVNETGAALENIRAAVKNIVDEITNLSALTKDEEQTAEQIVLLVSQLTYANEQMAINAQEVASTMEESTATVKEVASRSTSVAGIAKQQNAVVNKFKL